MLYFCPLFALYETDNKFNPIKNGVATFWWGGMI
jgi:hypothetical protein